MQKKQKRRDATIGVPVSLMYLVAVDWLWAENNISKSDCLAWPYSDFVI